MRRILWLAVLLLCPVLPVLASPVRLCSEPVARRDGVQGRTFDLREIAAWPYGPSQAVACDPQRQLLFSSSARVVQCYSLSNPSQPYKVGAEFYSSGPVVRLRYDSTARRLYVAGSGGTLEIWDVFQPDAPLRLGQITLPGPAYGLALCGPLLYCAIPDQSLFVILNVFDPACPQELGRLELEYEPSAVVVSGGIAFLGCDGAVDVVDVSCSTLPRLLSEFEEESDYVTDMEQSGWLLYMATDYGVSIVDVSNPYALEYVSCTEDWDLGIGMAIELDGWCAYVADDEGNLAAVDVSNPAYPVASTWITAPNEATYDVCRMGTTVCLAAGGDGVIVVDATHPVGPDVLSQFGQWGEYYDVVVAESGYVYAWLYDTLQVWDLSNPRSPRLSGACGSSVVEPEDAAFRDGYLYWSCGTLCIADVRDPANPCVLSDSLELEGDRFDVGEGFLYSAPEDEFLHVYDVRDKSRPEYYGYVPVSGVAVDLSVTGNLCCVAAEEGGLVVLDLSEPGSPAVIGRDTTRVLERVVAHGKYAYCTSDDTALLVFDLTDPTQPREVGSYYNPEFESDLQFTTDGRYVIFPYEDMGLYVVDVTDPSRPTEVARVLAEDYPFWAAIDREVAYVSTEERAILALDASNPAAMHAVSTIPGWGSTNSVAAANGRMYVGAGYTGLITLDATRLPLEEVSRIEALGIMRFVTVVGSRAYILNASSLTVADVTVGSEPRVLGQVKLPKYGRGLTLAGNYAYVADYTEGFVIVDISDPAQPHIIGSIDKPRRAYGVAVSGSHAYVANYETSSRPSRCAVDAFDVADPTCPQLVDSCGFWSHAYDIALKDSFVYLACGIHGCKVASIAVPGHPQPLDSFGTRDYRKLCVSGQYLYAAGDETGLQVFDLTNPAKPELVAQYDTPGSTVGVFVDKHYIYVADGADGALVLGKDLIEAVVEDRVLRPSLRVLGSLTRGTRLECVLELAGAADVALAVYNTAGQLVKSDHLVLAGPVRHNFDLSLAGLPAGAYFLRATGAGPLPPVKFILTR